MRPNRNQSDRAPRLAEEGRADTLLSSASDDEVGGLQARSARPRCSRRRSAGEADETRESGEDLPRQSFRRVRRRRRLSSEHRSERSKPLDAERKRAEQSNMLPMFLALDAGGTSTRAVVLDSAGRAYGYGRAGCGNPTAAGISAAANAIGLAAERAVAGSTGSGRPAFALVVMAGE